MYSSRNGPRGLTEQVPPQVSGHLGQRFQASVRKREHRGHPKNQRTPRTERTKHELHRKAARYATEPINSITRPGASGRLKTPSHLQQPRISSLPELPSDCERGSLRIRNARRQSELLGPCTSRWLKTRRPTFLRMYAFATSGSRFSDASLVHLHKSPTLNV